MTKLVEVALPLEAISAASRRDKDRKTGTIKNVHKWFAPMPTPAWRALLFAALVDDPGDDQRRKELLHLIERLVPDDGGAPDDSTLAEAHELIMEATDGHPPTVFDPFCGGGSTLVEAQRLGLPAAGSDLNPVPVLITRVLTELVPQVAGHPPLIGDPNQLGRMQGGRIDGFLADCRHYAQRVRDVVWDEIGHLYPEAPGGGTIVAWLWAWTVQCPHPHCKAVVPLATSYWLSKKKGAEVWLDPHLSPDKLRLEFRLGTGSSGPPSAAKAGRGGTFRCPMCDQGIPEGYVRDSGRARRLGAQLLALAVDRYGDRVYVAGAPGLEGPQPDRPDNAPDVPLHGDAATRVGRPAEATVADLFTNRQLVALGAFADAVAMVPEWVRADGGDETYERAVTSVLGLCVGKLAGSCSTQVRWRTRSVESKGEPAFGRHALPMVWDFAETNPFGGSVGDWLGQLDSVLGALRSLPTDGGAQVFQSDARSADAHLSTPALLATDPPYFAQIGYADLSDYFYVWLRRALASVHPDLFATVATPKKDELIAASYRYGGDRVAATQYFVNGFTETFHNLRSASAPDLPMLVIYAHRQEESTDEGAVASTAWDAMLTAILHAGLRIVGTWPIHATGSTRQIGLGTNALASYVVLVCRPQLIDAKVIDRQGFLAALRADLPRAIRKLQEGAISTIDLGQATIGPGMAIFSRFARIIEPSGESMTVRSALELIGNVQSEVLDEFVGDLDAWTRWAMLWYRDHGFDDGPFDDAEKLFKTTNSSLDGLVKAGIAASRSGKVRLLSRDELPDDWSPAHDDRVTVWEVTQHLVKRLTSAGGEQAASELLRDASQWGDEARNLTYWLSLAVARSRPKEALDYDALVTSWPELARIAEREAETDAETLFD